MSLTISKGIPLTTNEGNPLTDRIPLKNIFTPKIQKVFREYADTYQCPYEYVVGAGFAAVMGAAGKRVCLKYRGFRNFPQEYVALVGRTGSGKTSPLKLLQPLRNRDDESFRAYEDRRKKYQLEVKPSQRTVEDEPKWEEQILLSDTTPEALYECLAYNKKGMLQVFDELAGMFANFGRYNKSDESQKLLSIYNNETFSINRKSKAPIYCQEPCLSIIGGIQPSVLAKVFSKYDDGSGLLGRWIFFVPSSDDVPEEESDSVISLETFNVWKKKLEEIISLEGVEIELDSYAKEIYQMHKTTNHININNCNDDFEREYRSKLDIHILRVALVLHLLSDNVRSPINVSEMANAVQLCELFLNNALSLSMQMRQQSAKKRGATASVKEKILTLLECCKEGITVSNQDIAELVGCSRKTAWEVQKAWLESKQSKR